MAGEGPMGAPEGGGKDVARRVASLHGPADQGATSAHTKTSGVGSFAVSGRGAEAAFRGLLVAAAHRPSGASSIGPVSDRPPYREVEIGTPMCGPEPQNRCMIPLWPASLGV